MREQPACIGLGSNLADPPAQLRAALRQLDRAPGLRLRAVSPFYRSAALTPPGDARPQPDYCNAVAVVASRLGAQELLAVLLGIERARGRERGDGLRWQPRPLDLDLLALGRQRIDRPGLRVPHPEFARRRFVLQPWCDVMGSQAPPGLAPVQRLLEGLPGPALRPWGDS